MGLAFLDEGGKSPSQINKVGAYSVVTQWEPRRWGKQVGKSLDLGVSFGGFVGDWVFWDRDWD